MSLFKSIISGLLANTVLLLISFVNKYGDKKSQQFTKSPPDVKILPSGNNKLVA